MILNKITLNYEFDSDQWDYSVLISDEDIDGYFGKNAICKALFTFLDFERLANDDTSGFRTWLLDKYRDDALEEYKRYML